MNDINKMSQLEKEELRLNLYQEHIDNKHTKNRNHKYTDKELRHRENIRNRIAKIENGEKVSKLNLIIEIRLFVYNLLHHSANHQNRDKNKTALE